LAREALKQKQRVQADALAVQQGADEQGQVAQRMQAELARMEARLKTMELSKSSIVHARQKARGGESGEVLGTRGPGPTAFEAFREIEERVDHQDFEQQAMREVDAALGAGAHAQDVEAKFRQLEAQAAGSPAPGSNAGADVEAELAALKKRVSV
jgi:phage shock protein A